MSEQAPTPFGRGICPVCGSAEFLLGQLIERGDVHETGFMPTRSDPIHAAVGRIFGAQPLPVVARACNRCGHIQLFTDTSDDKKKKHDEE